MKGGELRSRPADRAGLSISQRRALVLARLNNGLVQAQGVYRASFAPGAEKVKTSTVDALVARGFLMRAGERLAKVTETGRIEAEASEAMAREAVQRVEQERASRRTRAPKPVHRPYTAEAPATRRLPYVD
ncbi:MAG: hypothetical protein IOC42_01025 [Methylobacterium sp.]|nr:hypothetical protein [Methylobacterium sp.]MCA3668464.1 hypothetical protein [Methylobacterium sp.]MCA3675486.1 hypothetical protein [Methylobacterium sp.]